MHCFSHIMAGMCSILSLFDSHLCIAFLISWLASVVFLHYLTHTCAVLFSYHGWHMWYSFIIWLTHVQCFSHIMAGKCGKHSLFDSYICSAFLISWLASVVIIHYLTHTCAVLFSYHGWQVWYSFIIWLTHVQCFSHIMAGTCGIHSLFDSHMCSTFLISWLASVIIIHYLTHTCALLFSYHGWQVWYSFIIWLPLVHCFSHIMAGTCGNHSLFDSHMCSAFLISWLANVVIIHYLTHTCALLFSYHGWQVWYSFIIWLTHVQCFSHIMAGKCDNHSLFDSHMCSAFLISWLASVVIIHYLTHTCAVLFSYHGWQVW